MAYDYESAIRSAISDTAFSSKNVRKPSVKKKKSSKTTILPTPKPKVNALLANISNKDIERMNISDFKKSRLIRNKRALDYAPGGKWEDNFVNRLLPGVNDVNSVLPDAELDDWYSSRGLERGNYTKGLLNTIRKISPIGNLLGFVSDAFTKKDTQPFPTINPFMSNASFYGITSPTMKPDNLLTLPTPEELVQEERDRTRKEEIKETYPTLDDAQISELVEAEENIQSQQFPEIKTYGTSILPENIAQQIDGQQQMAMNPYAPTQTMARPVDLGLLSGANIGAEYTTMRRPDVTFKLGISPLAPIGRTDYSQTMLDELTKNGLLTGYNTEISRNLPEATLENPLGYKFGDPAEISGASARLLGYTPSGTGNEVMPYYNLTYGQQLEYQRMLDDLRNKAQQRNTQLNLLGY
jgi:hypothetical protein